MTLFCLLILTSRKDFVVYQDINAEPTKVTDNNFKDKVMIYCNLQAQGSCLGRVCEWQSCWNELVRHEKAMHLASLFHSPSRSCSFTAYICVPN